jgi:Armadillo/beta-catenin-like repeat
MNGLLDPLEKVLDHPKKVGRREACWVVSNIAAGTRFQVESLLNKQSLLSIVLRLFETDGNDVRK